MGCLKLEEYHDQKPLKLVYSKANTQSLGRGDNEVGIIVAGLNHAMHEIFPLNDPGDPKTKPKSKKSNIFAKTFKHFQIGEGEPLNINSSELDFSLVTKKNLVYNSKTNTYGLDLYKVDPINQTALALGKITLISEGNNQYSIQPDYYDFNIEWQNGLTKRNIATFGASMLHYGVNPVAPLYPAIPLMFGGPYWINFQGTVTIKP